MPQGLQWRHDAGQQPDLADRRHDLRVLQRARRTGAAACAGREQVSVNLASESAAVELATPVSADVLRQAVEKAGYSGAARTGRAAHRRHDLRHLRGTGREGAEVGARRDRGQRQPGDVERAGLAPGRHGAHAGAAAGGAARRLRGHARPTPTRRAAPPRRNHDPGWKVALAVALSAPLVLPMLGDLFGRHWMLPAAWQFAAGHAGAVLAGRALLPRRLDGAACRHRQHGPAGGAGHQRRLRLEPGAVGARRPAPVLRERRGGHHAGDVRQVAGGARQAAHAGRAGCAARAVAADGTIAARRPGSDGAAGRTAARTTC